MKVVSTANYSLYYATDDYSQKKRIDAEHESGNSQRDLKEHVNENHYYDKKSENTYNQGTLFVPHRIEGLAEIPLYYDDGKGTNIDHLV